MPKKGHNAGPLASERLRGFIERWERLAEEKKAITEDQADIMAEAKASGFDVKTIRRMIQLRKLSPDERAEQESLDDIYMAALGMLADTPLGNAAIRRLSPAPSSPDDAGDPDGDTPPFIADPPGAEPAPDVTVEQAAALGKAAQEAGKPVTANPFPARDPRRAAWDGAWCQAAGSDGMDIPASWKRTKKPKPNDGAAGAGDDNAGPAA